MHHGNETPPATKRARVPQNALMDSWVTDTTPGQVRLELEMIGDDNRRLVIAMSGTVRKVRADLDTLLGTVQSASHRLAEREVEDQYGLGGF